MITDGPHPPYITLHTGHLHRKRPGQKHPQATTQSPCSKCVSATVDSAENRIVDAYVNGDTATVKVTVGNGGHGAIERVWQDNHWRFKVGGSLSAKAQDAYKTTCR
jgi:hypothetical protein